MRANLLMSAVLATVVDHVAFENPDGRRILVLTNGGPQRAVQLRMGSTAADVAVPANSVAALEWA